MREVRYSEKVIRRDRNYHVAFGNLSRILNAGNSQHTEHGALKYVGDFNARYYARRSLHVFVYRRLRFQ